MAPNDELIQVVSELGLSRIEAEIYVYLLQHSPATGYKVAKGIARSFTNVYKALVSLQNKGAILVDEGASRLSRAVPIDELVDQYKTSFGKICRRALDVAERMPSEATDTRIYHLSTLPQVHERCQRMLSDAEERVLLELFPEPLEWLRKDIEDTAARGVDVSARVYRPDELVGVRMVLSPFGEETLRSFNSQWLSVFVDGRQFMLGHLFTGEEGVYQAIWSRNPFVARAFYDYVNSDFHHYAFRARLEKAKDLAEVRSAYAELQAAFPPGQDLGYLAMSAFFQKEFNSEPNTTGDISQDEQ